MKKTILFLVMLILFSLSSTSQNPPEIIQYSELSLDIDAKIKPSSHIYQGWGIYFDFRINNTNDVPLDNVEINYKLQDTETNSFFINKNFKISRLDANEEGHYWTNTKIQMPKGGLYNLLITAKSDSNDIKINGVNDPSLIFDTIKVWELNDVFILISIILGVLYTINIYKNHLSLGEVVVSHPRFYRLTKAINSDSFLLYLPLVFENTGNITRAISNLAIVLRDNKNNKKYLFSLENEMKSFDYTNKKIVVDFKNKKLGDIKTDIEFKESPSPAPQFIVNPKSSTTKYLLFSGKDYRDFKGGKFDVEVIGWLDGNEYKETLLSFETELKISRAFLLLDYWEKKYAEEKKPEFRMKVKSYFKKIFKLIYRGR